MKDMEDIIWQTHEKRLNENEVRFNAATKDFTEIKDALKQLTERINEGVSRTQQKLLDENKSIEKGILELKHSVDLNTEKMNNKIDIVDENLKKRVSTLEETSTQRDKVYLWAVVIAVVIGIVGFSTARFMEKLWPKDSQSQSIDSTFPKDIKAQRIRRQ